MSSQLCYFAPWSSSPCDGPASDPAHLIPQRVLKDEWSKANPLKPTAWDRPSALTGTDLGVILADRRNIRPACRGHHHAADHGFIEYPVPEETREFAAELGLDRYLTTSR